MDSTADKPLPTHVIMRETTLVLSGGSIGSTGVVLYVERVAKEAVVETKARNVPEAFFASGENRLETPLVVVASVTCLIRFVRRTSSGVSFRR